MVFNLNEKPKPLAKERDLIEYYNTSNENLRLTKGRGGLELLRMQELMTRYLPPPPAVIVDVGGGPGVYSLWLARFNIIKNINRRGYTVHLIDLVPLHIST